jgi:hypothetical protein
MSVHPSPFPPPNNSATIGHALAPFSQALDCRTDTQWNRVLDANGVVLARSDGAIAVSDTRLTNDEARRISKLIARLPELVELEKDRNKAKSRRKSAAA